jgi:hypothetical protein
VNKRRTANTVLILLALFTAGCRNRPVPTACPFIPRGLAFLDARFNPNLGLLNEAPQVAPNTYWLTNDNALAAYTLSQLGQKEQAATIQAVLQRYGYTTNNLIEIVWGATVPFPPHVARSEMIDQVGEAEIWQEFHDSGGTFDDWAEYANLGFLGALNEFNQGHKDSARAIFSTTLAQFDGTGFRDKAFDPAAGRYETYKLALALYTGAKIGAPVPNGSLLRQGLLAMQAASGGFYTHYRDWNTPEGDKNTETTALALLALNLVGCGTQ